MKLQKGRDFCSLTFPKCLEPCLGHSRWSVNIYAVNEWIFCSMLSFWQPHESILNFSLQKELGGGGEGPSVSPLCWSVGLVFFRPQAFQGFCLKAPHIQETLELPLRYEALLGKVFKTGTQDKSLPNGRPDLLGLRSRPPSLVPTWVSR